MPKTATPGGPEVAITDPFEVTHRDNLVAGLYDERRGYEQRVAIAEAEGNRAAAAHMRKHIDWVNEELARYGEDVPRAKAAKADDDDDQGDGLDKMNRDELNAAAAEAGVEDADKLPNKDAVVAAIREARG